FIYQSWTENDFDYDFLYIYSYEPQQEWIQYDYGKYKLDSKSNTTHTYNKNSLINLYVDNINNPKIFITESDFGSNTNLLKTYYGGVSKVYNIYDFSND